MSSLVISGIIQAEIHNNNLNQIDNNESMNIINNININNIRKYLKY